MLVSAAPTPRCSAPWCRSFARRILSGILWAAGAVIVMALLIAIPYGAHQQAAKQQCGGSH